MAQTDRAALMREFNKRGRRRKPPRTEAERRRAREAERQYASQGQAVESAANARNYSQDRARTEREQSQQYYRRKLGYDKPSSIDKAAKKVARKVKRKVRSPF